ncbi:MAG: hypothetical protein HFH11_10455 [Dorea sp.]|jgi:hypothetical protein|nr:hypothetical protein [Dorea sp.]
MRHIYIRGSLGLIWLAAAIVCGISGNFQKNVENHAAKNLAALIYK